MVFNGEGCATIVLLYTESVEKNDEEGKEKKNNCSTDLARCPWVFRVVPVPLS